MEKLLLTLNEVAQALGIGRRHFYRVLPTLRALGLRQKMLGKRRRFVAADLRGVIDRMDGDGVRRRKAAPERA